MFGLVAVFEHSESFRSSLESLLRVGDVPGTIVLCLALAIALGAMVRAVLGFGLLIKDFKLSLGGIGILFFQSVAAGVIGAGAAYATLQLFEPVVNLQTVLGVAAQGTAAGVIGLVAAAATLLLLQNKELAEIIGSFRRKLTKRDVVVVEPSDVA
jgi:peptidoglycan biosynthesis protein MviN/MurJ (putative lipid II flippase)